MKSDDDQVASDLHAANHVLVESKNICTICLDNLVDNCEEITSNCCIDNSHAGFHRTCLKQYIESKVMGASPGTCPVLQCPNLHQDNRHRILIYGQWIQLVQEEVKMKFNTHAQSLLSILCGGCHAVRNIGYEYSLKQKQDAAAFLQELMSAAQFQDYATSLQGMQNGELTIDEFYSLILLTYLPQLQASGDKEAINLFKNILLMVADPERRANLHLRYLRDRPRTWVPCCDREHCFRCKTKDFHTGKTCLENTMTLDSSVVKCPHCAVSITKGDGCNSITCLCGKQFSWSVEKELTEREQAFKSAFPEDTHQACVDVLCQNISGEMSNARAWKLRNPIAINAKLLAYWRNLYPLCPTQCCVILQQEPMSEGKRMALEIWQNSHMVEVLKRKDQDCIAVSSVFKTMFPTDSQRYDAKRRLKHHTNCMHSSPLDRQLFAASAKKWVDDNTVCYNEEKTQWEARSAIQFLQLYGSRSAISARPINSLFCGTTEWNTGASNNALTFTNQNSTVQRVGSASCYPAAFADVPSGKCSFSVMLDKAPRGPNWLTFGLAKKGMAGSSSDGVGRTMHSWGICDDRSSSGITSAMMAANGNTLSHCRKLQEGDVLTCAVDLSEGWCDLSVNDNEVSYRFQLSGQSTSCEDYWFAMTFANDHQVSIYCDLLNPAKTPLSSFCQNIEHLEMYINTRKFFQKIVSPNELNECNQLAVASYARDWLKFSEDSFLLAEDNYTKHRGLIEDIVGISSSSKSIDRLGENETDTCLNGTWNQVLYALCWYRMHREKMDAQLNADLAQSFLDEHGSSAPFMAAATLSAGHIGLNMPESIRKARAFMLVYKDDCNDWYNYNQSLKEPMLGLENTAKGCSCLPRHITACPACITQK